MASGAATSPGLAAQPIDQHPSVAGHGTLSAAPAPSIDVPIEDPARDDGDAAEAKISPIESEDVRLAGIKQSSTPATRRS
jgi:hypothetical protein